MINIMRTSTLNAMPGPRRMRGASDKEAHVQARALRTEKIESVLYSCAHSPIQHPENRPSNASADIARKRRRRNAKEEEEGRQEGNAGTQFAQTRII